MDGQSKSDNSDEFSFCCKKLAMECTSSSRNVIVNVGVHLVVQPSLLD